LPRECGGLGLGYEFKKAFDAESLPHRKALTRWMVTSAAVILDVVG
jgi:hypothetical protein